MKSIDFLAEKVVTDVDVLCSCVEFGVLGQGDRTLVIVVNMSRGVSSIGVAKY